jgi:hypothetical protein
MFWMSPPFSRVWSWFLFAITTQCAFESWAQCALHCAFPCLVCLQSLNKWSKLSILVCFEW